VQVDFSAKWNGWRGSLAILVIALVYLIVFVPAPGISLPWMLVDDGLFFRWTISIKNGDWLGPWDYLTTSKGPLHSILVAQAYKFALNPFAYRRLFYLIASIIFVHTALPSQRAWLRVLTLIVLLSDPYQFGATGLRNLREGTYLPLQLLAFGFGSYVLDRLHAFGPLAWIRVLFAALGSGLCFGLLLITREGRIIVWVELALLLFIAAVCLIRSQSDHRQQLTIKKLFIYLMAGVLVVAMTLLPLSILRSINREFYAAAISNSMEEGGFAKFYSKLANLRIRGDNDFIPRVPVKKRAIEKAIQELPDQPGDLRSILKGIDWRAGEDYGCKTYPDTCNDMASGWLQWAIRKSIATSIPSKDEVAFQVIIASAGKQLDQLCRTTKTLECVPLSSGYLTYPSRWGFRDPASAVGSETLSVFKHVLLPIPFPLGRPDLSRSTFNSPLIKQDLLELGIRSYTASEMLWWQRLFVGASLIGTMARWILILLLVIAGFTAWRTGYLAYLFDPTAAWLGLGMILHCLLYIVIGLTSFPGTPYTVLATSLAICLNARMLNNYIVRPKINAMNVSQNLSIGQT
jgi:hypothetical protein